MISFYRMLLNTANHSLAAYAFEIKLKVECIRKLSVI